MKPTLSIIPLGGMGTVTKNMFVYQYGHEVLIVDCGIGFPQADMLGVDVLIPDVTYLQSQNLTIVGMLLTHGHDDHIAGLPYILPQLPDNFPIYGSHLTIGFAQDRVKEFGLKPNFTHVPSTTLEIGPFKIDAINMTHSVPDCRHYVISVGDQRIYHGTDFKFDLNPIDGITPDFQSIAMHGSKGITALLSDSLNAELSEFSTSESSLLPTFEHQFAHAQGQIIFTAMSSNLHRIQAICDLAERYGRQVCLVGRSIEQNVKTALGLGFFHLKPHQLINKRKIATKKPHQVCIIIAGSQGQSGSSLTRAAQGDHEFVRIHKEDTVVFASEPIPGNEQNVYAAIDTISRLGANVVYSDIADNLHASGHSSRIEQQILIKLLTPEHLIPIGGTFHHMVEYRKTALNMGYRPDQVHILSDGDVITFTQKQAKVVKSLDLKNIMVDGLGIGDVGQIVLRDRQQMSGDGIVVIMIPISQQTSQLAGDVEVISRGFVYVKESQALIDQISATASACLPQHQTPIQQLHATRKQIENAVEKLIYQETERRPLILTVPLQV